jgi:hypothetical protein
MKCGSASQERASFPADRLGLTRALTVAAPLVALAVALLVVADGAVRGIRPREPARLLAAVLQLSDPAFLPSGRAERHAAFSTPAVDLRFDPRLSFPPPSPSGLLEGRPGPNVLDRVQP